jgi:acyl-CoA thioesterase-1
MLALAGAAVSPGAQTAHQATIVCFGDSLTAGHGAMAGQSYPMYLERDLAQQGLRPRVINAGVDGDTAKDGLERLPSVLAMHPDVVVLEFGANDGLRGMPVPTTEAELSSMIDRLQKAHVRVMLAGMYMPPNYGPDYVKQFDAMYPELARRYKVPLLPFLLQDVYGVEGKMSDDGIHPNGEGYQIVAHHILPVLLPLLSKQG